MPHMSGLQLQQALKQRKLNLPVIAISARDDADTSLLARQMGARFFSGSPWTTRPCLMPSSGFWRAITPSRPPPHSGLLTKPPKWSSSESKDKDMKSNKSNQHLSNPTLRWLALTASALLICTLARADVLELKNGKVLTGKYLGGTAGTVRFETSAGTEVIETSQALALTFSGGAAAAAPAPAAAPTAAPAAPAPGAVTVNAGTVLLVRLVDPVSSKDPKGKRFATTLETDLVVNGMMIAKAGTKAYGRVQSAQQAGRYAGQSTLDLRLTELAVGTSLVPIMTGPYAQAGDKSIKKTAKGAAAGAAIGAIAGEAGKGAAIGAMASGVKKGQAVTVPPGTLLEFQLQQPVNITVAR